MKEIEAKAAVKNPQKTLALIKEHGIELGKEINQHDKIYSPKDLEDFTAFWPGVNFLRIRRENNKSYLTLKSSQFNEAECREEESEISNPEAVESIIELLGYKLSVELHKVRRKAKYQGLEICIDEVKNLGTFIEIEKLTDDDVDIEKVQDELFTIIEQFGVSKNDRITQGYDTQMAIKLGIK